MVVYTISKITQTAEQHILGFLQNYMVGSFVVCTTYNRKVSYLNDLQILEFNLTLILYLVKTVWSVQLCIAYTVGKIGYVLVERVASNLEFRFRI